MNSGDIRKIADVIKPDWAEPELVEALVSIGMNEKKFYEKRDAYGAVEFAKKVYLRETTDNLKYDLNKAGKEAKNELEKYWKREDQLHESQNVEKRWANESI